MHTLTVYTCGEHDHVVAFLDDEEVISNDYSMENVYRIAKHLGWKVVQVELSDSEFEARFA